MRHVFLLVALMIGMALQSHAQTTEIAKNGGSATIDAFGVCRIVTNNNSDNLMVPHASAAEWSTGSSSFIYEQRTGVKVAECSTDAIVTTCAAHGSALSSLFPSSVWGDKNIKKVVIVSACNVCSSSSSGSAMSVGTAWEGELELRVRSGGQLRGAPGRPGFSANALGRDGQRMKIIVEGGLIASGGTAGVRGANGLAKIITGYFHTASASCSGGSCTITGDKTCRPRNETITGANGGNGGVGAGCINGVVTQAGSGKSASTPQERCVGSNSVMACGGGGGMCASAPACQKTCTMQEPGANGGNGGGFGTGGPAILNAQNAIITITSGSILPAP